MSALLVACVSEPSPDRTNLAVVDEWRNRLTSPEIVVLTLFFTNSVIGIDPTTSQVARIADLDLTRSEGPSDTAVVGTRIFFADSAPGGFGVIDPLMKSVSWNPRPTEVGFAAVGAEVGPDGAVYVTANYAAPRAEGVLFTIDPNTLQIMDERPVPYGQQTDVVFNDDGELWAIAIQGPPEKRGVTISPTGKSTAFLIKGRPFDLAMTPWGNPLLSLYDRNAVVEIDDRGEIVGSLNRIESFPWGIAVDQSGKGVVVAEGIPGKPGAVYFVDFRKMRILSRVSVTDCQAPREAVLVAGRAVVSCSGPAGVLIFDLDTRRLVEFVSLTPWTNPGELDPLGDEPRGLSVYALPLEVP